VNLLLAALGDGRGNDEVLQLNECEFTVDSCESASEYHLGWVAVWKASKMCF
jgi:hypothetical protein